ncbi:MAG: hypothetical protein AB7F43_04215 [Bacteriovoracia bacterium]
MKTSSQGILALISYTLVTTLIFSYRGKFLQGAPVVPMVFISTLIMCSAFTFKYALGRKFRGEKSLAAVPRNAFTFLNFASVSLATAISWVASFFANLNMEPASTLAVSFGIAPIVTLILQKIFGKETQNTEISTPIFGGKTKLISALGILTSVGFLIKSAVYDGHEGTGFSSHRLLLGFICAIISGIANGFAFYSSKRLVTEDKTGKSPMTTTQLLASQFYLTLFATALLLPPDETVEWMFSSPIQVAHAAMIGIFGTMNLFFRQTGIEKTANSFIVSLITAWVPLVAFVPQFFDGRLTFSGNTLFGVIAIVLLSLLGLVADKINFRKVFPTLLRLKNLIPIALITFIPFGLMYNTKEQRVNELTLAKKQSGSDEYFDAVTSKGTRKSRNPKRFEHREASAPILKPTIYPDMNQTNRSSSASDINRDSAINNSGGKNNSRKGLTVGHPSISLNLPRKNNFVFRSTESPTKGANFEQPEYNYFREQLNIEQQNGLPEKPITEEELSCSKHLKPIFRLLSI